MLDYLRFALYAVIAAVGFSLVQLWQTEHPAPVEKTTQVPASTQQAAMISSDQLSQNHSALPQTISHEKSTEEKAAQVVEIKNNVLALEIDTRGGNIIKAQLLKYPEQIGSQQSVILLNNQNETRYLANSGLMSATGPDSTQIQAVYQIDEKNTSPQMVRLIWKKSDGSSVEKTFQLKPDSYLLDVEYAIHNAQSSPWNLQWFAELARTNTPPKTANQGIANLATYFGAAISSPEKPFQKVTFKDIQTSHLQDTIKGGWAAMVQHYFVSAWIPPQNETATYFSRLTQNNLYAIGLLSQPIVVEPNQNKIIRNQLYIGPAITEKLKEASPTLGLTVDYGVFWILSQSFFSVMKWIYDWTHNWGVAIILVTILIKALFYYLSAKSYRSMSLLKKLQPKVEALKKMYGEDKQKLSQATLELYRKEKVNPMSGCLPILIQIPFFIALYWVLVESVELRQAPFILWIKDLSQPDPYYILTLLMVASMYLQQRLNPAPADPMQAKVMMAMPLIFGVLFAHFPAGLMLYWVVNNTLSFLQQWWIMRSIEKKSS